MTSLAPPVHPAPESLTVTNSVAIGGKVLVLLSALTEADLPAVGSSLRVKDGAGTWWLVVAYADRQADHHAGGHWAEVRVSGGRPCPVADRGPVEWIQDAPLAGW